jgi:hypothetical protein
LRACGADRNSAAFAMVAHSILGDCFKLVGHRRYLEMRKGERAEEPFRILMEYSVFK